MEQPKSLSAVLCNIYTTIGPEALKNSDKILGIFTDIAPNLKAERVQLEMFLKSGCLKIIAEAHGKSPADINRAVAEATDILSNTYFMEKSKADYLCRTYICALSGKSYNAAPKITEPAIGTTVKPPDPETKKDQGAAKPSGMRKFLAVICYILLPFMLYFLIGAFIRGDDSSASAIACGIAAMCIFLFTGKKKKGKK